MKEDKDRVNRAVPEVSLQVYDPENPPYIRIHTCELLRDLPELSPEDIANCKE